MKINSFTLIGLSMSMLSACHTATEKQTAPKIIYVFPDQYRNMAMGFWNTPEFQGALNGGGDPVRTPNLNRFAQESLVLSNAMSNFPVSSPHRGCLMTGMYPHLSGVTLNCNSTNVNSSLRTDVKCLGDVFHENGYECAYIGKYHLDHPRRNDPQNPGHYVNNDQGECWDAYTEKERRHGFDYWYSYGTFDVHKNPHYWDNDGNRTDPKVWSPLHEADKAISYLKNDANQRDKSKPFFMMVAMNPPHTPCHSLNDCMEEDYQWYKDKPVDSLLIRPNVDFSMKRAADAAYYFACVTGVDRAFGKILDCLKEEGLDKNTIVIFTSDHGETFCSQGATDPKNLPFREAMNVPFLVRYPEHIRPRVDNLIMSSPDIMPTLLGLADLQAYIPETVQGTNYASIFTEKDSHIQRPKGALYIKYARGEFNKEGKVETSIPIARGLKTQNYTLALFVDKENKLEKTYFFNDEKDPYQLQNLPLDSHPEIVKEILDEMGRQMKEFNDPWYTNRILDDLIDYDK